MIKQIILFSLVIATPVVHPLDLFVSPNGSDQNSGAADSPFKTLVRARDEIRRQKPVGATVHLHGGLYALSESFELSPEDSGTTDSPVVYEALPNETPIISGGEIISGFKADEKGRWVATLPEVHDGKWDFAQLFVNGSRRFRPRMPKHGYYTIAGELPPTERATEKHGYDRFTFRPGEFQTSFKNLNDVEALCFSPWFVSRLRVAAIDEKTHTVTFTGPTGSNESYAKLAARMRFIVENAAESLGEPGEFYLDRHSGILTYIPMPGEKLEDAVVIAPRVENILLLKGDEPGRHWVHDVIFRGLSFQHSNWITPAKGHVDLQAEDTVRGAIYATGAQHCAWERCRVEHVGGYGIDLGAGCQKNRIEACVLSDLGAGGIRVGEEGTGAPPDTRTAGNRVVNNLIIHGGRTLPAGVGIFVLQSSDNIVQHNEITEFYYTGISSGWTWGYGPSLATGDQYLDNYVHQIGQGVLSDMGGIYTLGNHTGSVIRGNHFEDIWCDKYGGWGIYFDEGSTGVLAENNWVRHTRSGGIHMHLGKENIVRNNVFADSAQEWLQRALGEADHPPCTFEHNIATGQSKEVFKGNWKDQIVVDRNVYWRPNGPATFAGDPFEMWQKNSGQDAHSFFADPGLVDIDHGDFHVKPGSAAEKVGFKFFDARDAGLTGDMKKIARPTAAAGFPVEEPRYDQR